MIQLNLLPDVKMEYLKAQRARRLATVLSFLVTAVAIAILVLLFIAEGVQKYQLNNLRTNVSNETAKLKNEPKINKILTIQSQLTTVNSLHAQEPAASRLFDYLNELTPVTININNLSVSFDAHTLTITGGAGSLAEVDQYVDTLKFTKYSGGAHSHNLPAFSNVVLSSFSLNTSSSTGSNNATPATFTITTNFDSNIFNTTRDISLVIPNEVTTRSDQENPGPLFVNAPPNINTGRGQ
jgi:Tfp pilus assembly protein PilN